MFLYRQLYQRYDEDDEAVSRMTLLSLYAPERCHKVNVMEEVMYWRSEVGKSCRYAADLSAAPLETLHLVGFVETYHKTMKAKHR